MNKFIIVITFLVLSCSPTSQNETRKIDVKKEISQIDIDSSNYIEERKPSVIYDTSFFPKGVADTILNEKYKESQSEFGFYKKFIKEEMINKLKVIDEKNILTEIKYLGEIKDLGNKNSYHVITNFKVIGVGERLAPRGYSEVAFVNLKNNRIMIYKLSMPYELPHYIESNILYFEIERTKIGISIYGGLPLLLCIPEIGCY